MSLFGKNYEAISESMIGQAGLIIEVQKVYAGRHKVTTKILDRESGEIVYKTTTTHEGSAGLANRQAEEEAREWISRHGYSVQYIDTNVEQPVLRTSQKRSR